MRNFWQPTFKVIREEIKKQVPGARILCIQVGGSHCHNTNIEGSDVDYRAVYAAPFRSVIGVRGFQESIDRKDPDWQAHEVLKFVQLVAKGNPTIVEMLFQDKMQEYQGQWGSLRQMRLHLLSRHTVLQYMGYLLGQMKRLRADAPLHTTGGKYNTKWAYHAARLAFDAERVAQGEAPIVWKTGLERRTLMEIRGGEWTRERLDEFVMGQLDRVDDMEPWKVPAGRPYDVLDRWLQEVRR